MQKGTLLLVRGLIAISLLYLFGHLLWAFRGVSDESGVGPELNVDNFTVVHGDVVLLTALTPQKLDVFSGIDNFYGKVWENRQSYASLHGNQ